MTVRRFTSRPRPSVSGLWYHGDASRRQTFDDQRMDRDAHLDKNAWGPGIYWTRDEGQARGYAWPSGYVYAATVRTTRVLEDDAPVDPAKVGRFIDLAPADSRETGLSNWHENAAVARRRAVEGYCRSGRDLLDALLGVYNDFYGQDAGAFARAMVRLGYDSCLHHLPEVDHLIVYDPRVIQVVREERYRGEGAS